MYCATRSRVSRLRVGPVFSITIKFQKTWTAAKNASAKEFSTKKFRTKKPTCGREYGPKSGGSLVGTALITDVFEISQANQSRVTKLRISVYSVLRRVKQT
jgi:hypothetical protein